MKAARRQRLDIADMKRFNLGWSGHMSMAQIIAKKGFTGETVPEWHGGGWGVPTGVGVNR